MEYKQESPIFFQKQPPTTLSIIHNDYLKDVYSTDLIAYSEKLGCLLYITKTEMVVIKNKQMERVILKKKADEPLDEFEFGDDDEPEKVLKFIKLSVCERYFSVGYDKHIAVLSFAHLFTDSKVQSIADFQLDDDNFTYMEWPNIVETTDAYQQYKKDPYFLSLLQSEKFQINYLKNEITKEFTKDRFRCGILFLIFFMDYSSIFFQSMKVCLSRDGNLVIGMNFDQKIIIVDINRMQIVATRIVSDVEKLITLNIFQISTTTTVIASLYKDTNQPIENSRALLSFIRGNLLSSRDHITIYHSQFKNQREYTQDKPIEFKFVYLEKRDILFVANNHSMQLDYFYKNRDNRYEMGNPVDFTTTRSRLQQSRGFVLYRSVISKGDEHRTYDAEYQGKKIKVPTPPIIFMLTNDGELAGQFYIDCRYPLTDQSLITLPMGVEDLRKMYPELKPWENGSPSIEPPVRQNPTKIHDTPPKVANSTGRNMLFIEEEDPKNEMSPLLEGKKLSDLVQNNRFLGPTTNRRANSNINNNGNQLIEESSENFNSRFTSGNFQNSLGQKNFLSQSNERTFYKLSGVGNNGMMMKMPKGWENQQGPQSQSSTSTVMEAMETQNEDIDGISAQTKNQLSSFGLNQPQTQLTQTTFNTNNSANPVNNFLGPLKSTSSASTSNLRQTTLSFPTVNKSEQMSTTNLQNFFSMKQQQQQQQPKQPQQQQQQFLANQSDLINRKSNSQISFSSPSQPVQKTFEPQTPIFSTQNPQQLKNMALSQSSSLPQSQQEQPPRDQFPTNAYQLSFQQQQERQHQQLVEFNQARFLNMKSRLFGALDLIAESRIPSMKEPNIWDHSITGKKLLYIKDMTEITRLYNDIKNEIEEMRKGSEVLNQDICEDIRVRNIYLLENYDYTEDEYNNKQSMKKTHEEDDKDIQDEKTIRNYLKTFKIMSRYINLKFDNICQFFNLMIKLKNIYPVKPTRKLNIPDDDNHLNEMIQLHNNLTNTKNHNIVKQVSDIKINIQNGYKRSMCSKPFIPNNKSQPNIHGDQLNKIMQKLMFQSNLAKEQYYSLENGIAKIEKLNKKCQNKILNYSSKIIFPTNLSDDDDDEEELEQGNDSENEINRLSRYKYNAKITHFYDINRDNRKKIHEQLADDMIRIRKNGFNGYITIRHGYDMLPINYSYETRNKCFGQLFDQNQKALYKKLDEYFEKKAAENTAKNKKPTAPAQQLTQQMNYQPQKTASTIINANAENEKKKEEETKEISRPTLSISLNSIQEPKEVPKPNLSINLGNNQERSNEEEVKIDLVTSQVLSGDIVRTPSSNTSNLQPSVQSQSLFQSSVVNQGPVESQSQLFSESMMQQPVKKIQKDNSSLLQAQPTQLNQLFQPPISQPQNTMTEQAQQNGQASIQQQQQHQQNQQQQQPIFSSLSPFSKPNFNQPINLAQGMANTGIQNTQSTQQVEAPEQQYRILLHNFPSNDESQIKMFFAQYGLKVKVKLGKTNNHELLVDSKDLNVLNSIKGKDVGGFILNFDAQVYTKPTKQAGNIATPPQQQQQPQGGLGFGSFNLGGSHVKNQPSFGSPNFGGTQLNLSQPFQGMGTQTTIGSFNLGQTGNTNLLAGQQSANKPAFGQANFGQSSFGQPAFGQASFGQPSFGQSSFGNVSAFNQTGGMGVSQPQQQGFGFNLQGQNQQSSGFPMSTGAGGSIMGAGGGMQGFNMNMQGMSHFGMARK